LIALGREAILAGDSVQFTPAATLLAGLAKAPGQQRLDENLLEHAKPKLLIVEELGYLRVERDAAHLFFQLVSRRDEIGAMLITSNRGVAQWATVFVTRWSRPRLATGSSSTATCSRSVATAIGFTRGETNL
jgi:DNA replication protein DnaC